MNSLLIHPTTANNLERLIGSQHHGILLAGPEGAGKASLALYLLQQRLELTSVEELIKHPYFLKIEPVKGTISIDDIRKLQSFMQLKTTGKKPFRRAVLIADAHTMTIEAQNALLKSLEEPPSDTVMVLTTSNILDLIPTVRSRVQQVDVIPPEKAEIFKYFASKNLKAEDVEKAYALSNGYIGLLTAILDENEEHLLLNQVNEAKKFISLPAYERLSQVDSLTKQKEDLGLFLQSCRLVCNAALSLALQKADQNLIHKCTHSLETIYKSEAALTHNPNTKLLLTYLALNL